MGFALQNASQLIRRKDGAYFDFAIDLLELEPLSRFEIHSFTNLFRDYDLVFGG